jgi:YVTN family beta-propeller protein
VHVAPDKGGNWLLSGVVFLQQEDHMRRLAALFVLTMALAIVWLTNSVAAPRVAGAPIDLAAPGDPITHTVYLPLIAKPAPTLPYVLAKIRLPAGSHPHGIELDLDHQRAFVANHHANTLSVINLSSLTLSVTIPLAGADGPNGVAYSADLDRVYVANRNTNNLGIVDPTAGAWLKNVAVGKWPDGVAVMDGLVYVANFGSDSVSVINAHTEVISQIIPVYSNPALMSTNPAERIVYVALHTGATYIAAFRDGQTVPGEGSGPLPYGIAFDPIGYGLYSANRGRTHTVTVADTASNWDGEQFDVGQEVFVVGVNPRSGHIFAVCGDVVKIYDRRDLALVATIPIGSGAEEGIVVDAEHGLVFVTSGDTDEVTVIQDTSVYDIAFVSARLPEHSVFIMDDTGQHVHTLRRFDSGHRRDTQPAWSPDGKWLLYARNYYPSGEPNEDQYWNLYLSDHIGQEPRWLVGYGDHREPAWSPDGSKIVWRCGFSLCTMDVAVGSVNTLTIDGVSGSCNSPVWSPDGQWIAAICGVQIYIVPPTGGTAINISQNTNGTVDSYPSWSPDSSKIAFDTDRHYFISGTQRLDNYEIYVADIHTLQLTRLTNNAVEDRAPVWSPDGQWIAYAPGEPLFLPGGQIFGFDHELTLMKPDGTEQRRITSGLYMAGPFSWSPDGRRIALQSHTGAEAEIYVVDVATGAATRLTNNAVEDSQPKWRPDTWR